MTSLYKLSRASHHDMKYHSGKMHYLGIRVIENTNFCGKNVAYIFFIYTLNFNQNKLI